MGYTTLNEKNIREIGYAPNSLEWAALSFIRDSCEKLRFDKSRDDAGNTDSDGKSIGPGKIPFNKEKDIDRLCLENAVRRFLSSGKKEDAFDVYYCYLEMFVGDYQKTRRMIEMLSEYESNGSRLLMKHRDHYSHSVYVFALGLAIYSSNELFRNVYKRYYKIDDDKQASAHYLQYWGLSSLFHDIGYPFELPFEQVCSYFEAEGTSSKRKNRPFVSYNEMEKIVTLSDKVREELNGIFPGKEFHSTDELFAYVLTMKMGDVYGFSEAQMLECLTDKPTHPEKFGYFMDHAYFSSTILFRKLFDEMDIKLGAEHIDALTAILIHNSLYKYSIAYYYNEEVNKPFRADLHPLAYMLMLCDELQCWDRTAYGRNSRKELHPMGCNFDFSDNKIKAVYLFDEREIPKINRFKDEYIEWLREAKGNAAPKLKAYSDMYITKNGVSDFKAEIERIVDLSDIQLNVETGLAEHVHTGSGSYLSDSNYISLYNFAIVLNGRWNNGEWKRAKNAGQEEQFLSNSKVIEEYTEEFKSLSLEYQLSNINQAKAFAEYLNMIGCFYTDRDVDFELVEKFGNEELIRIGKAEHKRWLQEHYDMGWTYGEPKDKLQRENERKHKDMIPDFYGFDVTDEAAEQNYARLDKAEQDKDKDPMECMLSMLRLFDGLRIYKL